jgi:hypothetical protein
VLLIPSLAAAQQTRQATNEQQLVNWYYSAVFGTGVYKAGDRVVSVLQIPFSHDIQLRNKDEWGVKITAPLSFGFYDFEFDELFDGTVPHSVSTASVFPGIELDVPVTSNWIVKPYASAGYAWEISGTQEATIYGAGLKSVVTLPIGRNSELSLGNQLTMSGYKPAGGVNQPMGVFVAGLNLEIPTGYELFGHPAKIGYHLIYYNYFTRLRFPTANNVENKISEQGEIAISLATTTPVSLRLFDLDRIGIAFRGGGGVEAVRIFFSLPY